jgi:predicted acylesterase/phospholipase RssA
VILHPPGTSLPAGTSTWTTALDASDHHHVRTDQPGDLDRVARFLAGRAVGLVLGGGGARGLAHIGIVRALRERGIPIDMVGGTSMGGVIAAQVALGWSIDRMMAMNERVWVRMEPHRAYRIPILSLVGETKITRAGRLMWGDARIEDLWLPFFCVSANLTTASTMVHRSGSLFTAVRASTSLPLVGVPVLHEGHLLVDGGIVDNLPAAIMQELGIGRSMVSVVSDEEEAAFSCERVPTQWETVRGRYFPGGTPPPFPSMMEILMRSALLSSVSRQMAVLQHADYCFQCPLAGFSLLDFRRMNDIVAAGYAHAIEMLDRWDEGGSLAALREP